MKKVKLMLVSFSVLAIGAAAMAFNIKGASEFCTNNPVNNSCANLTCPNDRTMDLDPVGTFICITPTSGDINNPCKDVNGNVLRCQPTSVRCIPD